MVGVCCSSRSSKPRRMRSMEKLFFGNILQHPLHAVPDSLSTGGRTGLNLPHTVLQFANYIFGLHTWCIKLTYPYPHYLDEEELEGGRNWLWQKIKVKVHSNKLMASISRQRKWCIHATAATACVGWAGRRKLALFIFKSSIYHCQKQFLTSFNSPWYWPWWCVNWVPLRSERMWLSQ